MADRVRTPQEQIVAQSQLKLTLDYFNMCGICPSMRDMIRISAVLERYVKEGYSKEIAETFEMVDIHINQVYKGIYATDGLSDISDELK